MKSVLIGLAIAAGIVWISGQSLLDAPEGLQYAAAAFGFAAMVFNHSVTRALRS